MERMVCFVVRESGSVLDEGHIMKHLRDELGAYKSPDRVVFCSAIPRTPTNKVKLAELQALAREHL
jgi:acyl-coenzyme A synthetase/AMP-(fatty) acid ligase